MTDAGDHLQEQLISVTAVAELESHQGTAI